MIMELLIIVTVIISLFLCAIIIGIICGIKLSSKNSKSESYYVDKSKNQISESPTTERHNTIHRCSNCPYAQRTSSPTTCYCTYWRKIVYLTGECSR